jgi:hypothetical protein
VDAGINAVTSALGGLQGGTSGILNQASGAFINKIF